MLPVVQRSLGKRLSPHPQHHGLFGTTIRNYLSSRTFSAAARPAGGGGPNNNNTNNNDKLIRLNKRMSELDICSRREADRFILAGRVRLNGIPVEPILGQKVPPDEQNIVLMSQSYQPVTAGDNIQSNDDVNVNNTHPNTYHVGESAADVQRRPREFSWDELQLSAVVLHKPVGYVSGIFEGGGQGKGGTRREPKEEAVATNASQQQQQPHIPAVRLLTPDNAHIVPANYYDFDDHCVNEAEYQEAKNIVDHRLDFELYRASNLTTLQHYVPAGRLDMSSAGLLVLTKNGGVLAKKLISPHGLLAKEYLVLVEPVQGLTRHEREAGMVPTRLPSKPTKNLSKFKQGGFQLAGEEHRPPLRPVVAAEWLRWSGGDKDHPLIQTYLSPEEDLLPNFRRRVLRIVLREGRKHQVRRMCREILGMHVVKLVRTRIGPIELDSLPEGRWRPLRQHEAEAIYSA